MTGTTQAAGSDGRSAAALYTLMSVMFINIMGFGIVVPLLPFYAQSFHAQPWQIALIFSAYSLGSFFGEPFWGRLSDRIGRKPVLVFTTLANCACYGALAFAPNIAVAFVIRLLGGMAAGSGSVVQGYIADVTAVDERADAHGAPWRGVQHRLHPRPVRRRRAGQGLGRTHRLSRFPCWRRRPAAPARRSASPWPCARAASAGRPWSNPAVDNGRSSAWRRATR